MSEASMPQSRDVASPVFENLEAWARGQVQGLIQALLEEEVTELLGRRKSERRAAVDAPSGYRNGHGKPRKLTMSSGTIEVRRPRVRGLEERFESRILPLFARRTKSVSELIPELYLHGLAEGDFDLALRGLLGEDAPLSASTVARLKTAWQAEWASWRERRLDELEVVYLWVDGVYVKAGLEKDKAAMLVVMAGLADGRKEFVSLVPGHRESSSSWAEVMRDLKRRGMNCPKLVVGDGHLGIWSGLAKVFPDAAEQRCWNHRIVNVLDKLPKRAQEEGKKLLTPIPYADSRAKSEKLRDTFVSWCRRHEHDRAADTILEDWDRMVTFYDFPKEHGKHLRTTNPVESPFAALRLRTDAAKRYKKVENATAVVFKMLMIGQQRFRRLDAPQLLREVHLGARFVDGKRAKEDAIKRRETKDGRAA